MMGKIIKIAQVNKEEVIIYVGIQSLCFHNWNNPKKKDFRLFKEELRSMRKRDLGKILHLANKYEVPIVSSRHIR